MVSPPVAASSRVRDVWRPAAVLAGATAALAWVAAVDPEQPGHYPTCPFLVLTDLYCPGCGSLRAVHALVHGDVATAVDRNVLTVAAVPVLVAAWVLWARRTLLRRPRTGRAVPAAAIWALLAVVVAFWVLRNLDAFSWLAP
jgi:hypothetical protein